MEMENLLGHDVGFFEGQLHLQSLLPTVYHLSGEAQLLLLGEAEMKIPFRQASLPHVIELVIKPVRKHLAG